MRGAFFLFIQKKNKRRGNLCIFFVPSSHKASPDKLDCHASSRSARKDAKRFFEFSLFFERIEKIFKKIDDFKVLGKKTKKGIILMLWKPNGKLASQVKSYEYSLTDENGEKQTVILHKKKLLLFKPKEGKTYHFHIFGKDKSGNTVAEAEFMMEQ